MPVRVEVCRCGGAGRWIGAKLTGDGGAGRVGGQVGGGAGDGVRSMNDSEKKGGDSTTVVWRRRRGKADQADRDPSRAVFVGRACGVVGRPNLLLFTVYCLCLTSIDPNPNQKPLSWTSVRLSIIAFLMPRASELESNAGTACQNELCVKEGRSEWLPS